MDNIAESLTTMMETLAPAIDAVVGYKAKLMEVGFEPLIAEHMAADLHSRILGVFFK